MDCSTSGKSLWIQDRLPIPVFLGFPCGSTGKESSCNVGHLGSILGLGRSLGEGNGYPLQYSCPANQDVLMPADTAAAAAAKLLQSCPTLVVSKVESESEVAQSCPTLCDPMDCSLPGSSVHGIFQARVLEWIAISFSRGSSQPKDRTQVSRIVDRRFTV